ncbi:sucrose-6-phosphate hydrolase [Bacillus sp. H-16]|uniref:glycoside hydrolase family 32 protein n=1 Tax=Alteribacter salitolerans TaxID=2912333 RepID=UPI0019631D66|nr:sucrose-6-phosphate hydrolase [Alteribacter salitolerans]MBM7095509.1 sucrose-6-phosphate hydrolase [Alteribacter salitolerans]
MTEREQALIAQADDEVAKHEENIKNDPYRLTYHLMSPVGLINDPNGWIQWNGMYHMFYQWNPFKAGHGAKFWGHYTSTDLVNWKHEPIALAPSEWYEKNGCYSGSAVDLDGKLTLFYTGNVKDEQGNRESYQCIAQSEDGITFDKQGPVIDGLPEGYTAHFRDPKVWKHNGMWYLVIGAQTEDLKGHALLYRSGDGREWTNLGPVAGAGIPPLQSFGYMWECPDMFSLGDKDVMIVSPQGLDPEGMHYHNTYQAGYFVGELDYETPKFHHGAFDELDRGFEFYAPQTTEDEKGRRILVGWMGVPDQQEDQHPTVDNGWIHCLTIPRELRLQGDRLIQVPVEELKDMRAGEVEHTAANLQAGSQMLEDVSGDVAELELTDFSDLPSFFEVELRGTARLIYDREGKVLTLERKNFADRLTEKRQCHLEELRSIRIFMDTSSLEIFVNGGEEVFTLRYFPSPQARDITFTSSEKAVVTVKKWGLKG